jgi:hypothetical protein
LLCADRAQDDGISDGSSWKPDWRNVWLWSAAISAALSAPLTFMTFAQESPASSFNRWEAYLAVWALFFAMLTLTGVVTIFRLTYSPDEVADDESSSAFARTTGRMLRYIARLLR